MSPEVMILMTLLTKATELATAMKMAQEEGRELSAEELDEFRRSLLDSDAELEEAINQARAAGR